MSTANNAPSRFERDGNQGKKKRKHRAVGRRERRGGERDEHDTTKGDEEDQGKKKAVAALHSNARDVMFFCAGSVFPLFFSFLSVHSPSHPARQAPLYTHPLPPRLLLLLTLVEFSFV